ncbi:MAG: VTT domain-containing protein [Myxococcota bacterium]
MSSLLRRLAFVAVLLVGLFGVGTLLRGRLGLDLEIEIDSIRRLAAGMGPIAPLLFVLVVAGRALLWLPSQIVLVAAGLCFGTTIGTLVGGAGLMLSGLGLFLLARYAGRDALERRLGERARPLFDLAADRRGAVALALASSYPLVPLSPLQASAGLTPMPIASFVPAALAGGLVRASTYAFFGDAMIGLEAHRIAAAAALALVVVVVPLALPAGRRWLRTLWIGQRGPLVPPEA